MLSAGWGVDALLHVRSAAPMSPSSNTYFFVGNNAYNARPDLVPGQPLYVNDSSSPGGSRFNPGAFIDPSPGRQGNFPRNGLRGLSATQVDLCVRREFALQKQIRVQIRAELFNAFNHPNFGQPTGAIGDPLFGQPTQMLNRSLGGLNALYQIGGPRSAELAAKLLF
jgi:hypothetical protein